MSTVSRTIIEVNPISPSSEKLKTWYASKGRVARFESVGHTCGPTDRTSANSMYSVRQTLGQIISSPGLGEQKPVYYTTRACMSFIRSDQTLYYRACKSCHKKVTEDDGSAYSFQSCKTTPADCTLRYIVSAKFTDSTGGAWISVFGDDAEKIIGCSAVELHNMKTNDDGAAYQTQLMKAMWVPHLLRLMVAPREYNNEKRQRITVKSVSPVDYAAESKYLLDDISSMQS